MKTSIKKEIFSWMKTVILSVIVALTISNFLIVNAQVPSGSMESTIMTGDRVIGFRLTYDFTEPERGDIIMFRFPDDESQMFIKRIIGLPGETINIIDGKVYINDSKTPLEEPYLTVIPEGSSGPFVVPADSYFMMGDNRNVSFDSRRWQHHFVQRDKIYAKAEFSYYPTIHGVE
jgi:signal peptidase I